MGKASNRSNTNRPAFQVNTGIGIEQIQITPGNHAVLALGSSRKEPNVLSRNQGG